MKILLATNNPGKVREIAELLALPGIELVSPADLGRRFEVVEDGTTFEANARLKADAAFRVFGLPALADDSGLEIDALGGRPGVHSARFLGEKATYPERFAEILKVMDGLKGEQRAARFQCCAVLAGLPEPVICAGTCEGRIAHEPFGAGGFGYDPIFVPEGYGQTFAELPGDVKNRISHRGKAFGLLRARLQSLGGRGARTSTD